MASNVTLQQDPELDKWNKMDGWIVKSIVKKNYILN